ncbi:hypothetical protein [uncultured Nostoc sp.]
MTHKFFSMGAVVDKAKQAVSVSATSRREAKPDCTLDLMDKNKQ